MAKIRNLLLMLCVFSLLVSTTAQAESYTIKSVKITDTKTKASYPQITPKNQQFNSFFKNYVDKTIKAFKKELFANRTDPRIGTYGLTIAYQIKLKSANYISILMDQYKFTGGAHGTPDYYAGIFSVKKGRMLKMNDIFRKETKYMDFLVAYCQKELLKREWSSDKDWVNRGTKPTSDNYRCYYLAKNSFVILFPPYQVAPYAAGPQEVAVPLSTLKQKGYLRNDFILP